MYNPAQNIAITSMEFVRGPKIDHGGFASIHLAKPFNEFSRFPPLIVVKSCESSTSMSLKNEREILTTFKNCPEVIQCFGDNHTFEDGVESYNLMLEYAEAGDLARKAGKLSESDVRFYTRSILRGIRCIHSKGYVHCDIKLRNILVFDGGDTVKIADFGLAKKAGEEVRSNGVEFRGTPLYMAPESVNRNDYEPPCDVWALGCAVVEMITGKPAWKCEKDGDFYGLMLRIGVGDELPQVPEELSKEGKDFLRKCFVKDPRDRWTAEMLLDHPFVKDEGSEFPKFDSPRDPFEFGDWDSKLSSSMPWICDEVGSISNSILIQSSSSQSSASERLCKLAKEEAPKWDLSESWITIRR